MKLIIDTQEKIITVQEQININELVKQLERMFPKGEWKEYKLDKNKVETYYIYTNTYPPPSPITCTLTTANTY